MKWLKSFSVRKAWNSKKYSNSSAIELNCYKFKTCSRVLRAGFGSALADIILIRIPAHPRGAYIRWGLNPATDTSLIPTACRGGGIPHLIYLTFYLLEGVVYTQVNGHSDRRYFHGGSRYEHTRGGKRDWNQKDKYPVLRKRRTD